MRTFGLALTLALLCGCAARQRPSSVLVEYAGHRERVASIEEALRRAQETAEPIGRLRRRWFAHGSAQVLCTYHPSYLLRNPSAKRDVWDDMKLLMERMGVTL